MNLFDGAQSHEGVHFGDFTIPLSERHPGGGGQVRIGIRPHDIKICDPDSAMLIGFEVEVVEPMGHETLVYCRRGPITITVAAEGRTRPMVGDMVGLRFATENLHLFDGESGLRK